MGAATPRWTFPRLAAIAASALMAIGGFEPYYVRMLRADAPRMREAFTELPYRKLTGFRRFLVDVDARTHRGAGIAIWLPFHAWEGGYGYGYYRAGFLLPGKQVIPLLDIGVDHPAPQNVKLADYVACWHGEPRVPGFETAWRSADGALLRRVR